MNRNTSPLLILILVHAICFIIEIDAGKGKVPIYIPIPIPMPMGPNAGGGGGKSFGGHHQQQHGDGEGEVKKIYLLQPVPRIQPVPQMKGGGFLGPVQTHIHMPAPIVQPQHHQQQSGKHHQAAKNSFYDAADDGGKVGPPAGGHHHHSDMKILPIVVIPPIAPIQMPHSQEPKRMFAGHQMQDLSSFANYGGSVGGSTYRETFGPRGKLRPTKLEQSTDAMDQFGFAASRARLSRNRVEDLGDYELGSTQTRSRYSHNSRQAPSRVSSGRRWSNGYSPSGRRKSSNSDDYQRGYQRSAGSIRDIIDRQRQVMFDDDSLGSEENRGSGFSKQLRDDYQEPRRGSSRYLANEKNAPSSLGHSSSEQREMAARSRALYGDSLPSSNDDYSGDRDLIRPSRQQQADLSSLYYDRDLQSADEQPLKSMHDSSSLSPSSGRYEGNGGPVIMSDGRRSYLDDNELLDDDEWAFDSVKSVTHVDSPSNVTQLATNTTATNTTTTSTTVPPPLSFATVPNGEKANN